MLSLIRIAAASVAPVLTKVSPQPSGVMPSEMLAFVSLCIAQDVDTVIESGRKHGYSTEVLAACLPNTSIVSIETSPIVPSDERLAAYRNVKLLRGDGNALVPQQSGNRIALLLDGPKGYLALNLVDRLRSRSVFGAVHDLCQGNEARADLAKTDKQVWYTDDPEFVAEFGHLDEFWWRNGGYSSREEMVRSAFCFGIFPGELWA